MANNESWAKIFSDYNILEHNFDESPFELSAQNIKTSCQNFTEVNQKEVRVFAKKTQEQIDHKYLLITDCFCYRLEMEII